MWKKKIIERCPAHCPSLVNREQFDSKLEKLAWRARGWKFQSAAFSSYNVRDRAAAAIAIYAPEVSRNERWL